MILAGLQGKTQNRNVLRAPRKKTMKKTVAWQAAAVEGSRFFSLEQCVLLSDLLLFPPTLTSLVPVGRWFHIVCRCVFISFDFSVFWLCLCQLSLPDVHIHYFVVSGVSSWCKSFFSTNVQKLVSSFQKKHVTFCHNLLATTFGTTKQETRKVRLTGSIMQVPSRFKIRPMIQVGEAVVAVVPLPGIDIDNRKVQEAPSSVQQLLKR